MANQLPFKTRFPLLNMLTIDGVTHRGQPILSYEPKLFDIDNIASYTFHTMTPESTEAPGKSVIEQTGPLRLPYRKMWAEYKMWGSIVLESVDGQTDVPSTVLAGAMCEEFSPGENERHEYFKHINGPDFYPDDQFILLSLYDEYGLTQENAWGFWVNSDGEYLYNMSLSNRAGNSLYEKFKNDADSYREFMSNFIAPILMAVGLANCHNIKTEDRVTKPTTKRRHRKRLPVPGTEYKVIKLPGAPSNRVDGEVENSGGTRYHTVRGHFKTYTAEKPLYGKLTGTWWWAPAVRGNKKHGEIISTYEQHTK